MTGASVDEEDDVMAKTFNGKSALVGTQLTSSVVLQQHAHHGEVLQLLASGRWLCCRSVCLHTRSMGQAVGLKLLLSSHDLLLLLRHWHDNRAVNLLKVSLTQLQCIRVRRWCGRRSRLSSNVLGDSGVHRRGDGCSVCARDAILNAKEWSTSLVRRILPLSLRSAPKAGSLLG